MEIIAYAGGVGPQASSLGNPDKWLVEMFGGGSISDSGVRISPESVLGATAAYFSVNRIGNDIAQLPLNVMMRRDSAGDIPDRQHPGGKIMRTQPGAATNPFHQRKTIATHSLLHGNGRAFIVRTGRTEPKELMPLDANNMRSVMIHDSELGTRQKWHLLYPQGGGPPIPLPDMDVLHIHGMSLNGIEGLDMLDLFKHSMGLTLGAEKFANRFFKNNGVPSLVLEAPPGAFRNAQDAEEFLRRFNDYHAGLENSQRVGLLREGIKANALSQGQKDGQLIESREFQVRELMRIYGMPMIPGVSDSQSYNTLEQLNRAYLLHCLGPWLRCWEAECNAKLLTQNEQQRETHYFEFDTDALLRPDAAQFGEMLTKFIGAEILNSNEARNELGYPPREGGDVYKNPSTSSNKTATADKNDKVQTMAAAKLRPLIAMEHRRVSEMAGKASNFLNWVEAFYVKHEQRLTAAIAEIDGPAWLAQSHCDESRELLLDLAGKSQTTSELSAAVTQAAAAWTTRLDSLAAACAGE